MPILSSGTWRETYVTPGKPWTLIHRGGPADGIQLTLNAPAPPQWRMYATGADRRRKTVFLSRYVLHGPVEIDVMLYTYSGTDERPGPAPGRKESPAWSW